MDYYDGLVEEIAFLETQQKALANHLRDVKERKRRLEAVKFIRTYCVTMDDIELSVGDGKPWFYTLNNFVDWLGVNSSKPFAEWNTIVFFQSDLKSGLMPMDEMPVRLSDVTK